MRDTSGMYDARLKKEKNREETLKNDDFHIGNRKISIRYYYYYRYDQNQLN